MNKNLSIVVAVVALLGLPTLARAHAQNNDTNVVHACIGNVSKIVRIVGVNGSCISSPGAVAETPAHWNIQGPPGTNGTNGTNGTDGTDGTNGIDGTNGTPVDPPCFDNSNRYVNCSNGTVTDTVTGLVWLTDAACLGTADWAAANGLAAALADGQCNLTDQSSPGDWRLPTKDEWSATIARAVVLGCNVPGGNPPTLTNDAGTACYGDGSASSFVGVFSATYWSSTAHETNPAVARVPVLGFGFFGDQPKDLFMRVWPVRGGLR